MIGTKTGWMTGALVSAALLAGATVPAQARPRYDDRGWHHRHHRGDGFDFGDAVGIAALVGAVAIVANSISKDRKAAQASGPAPDDRPYAGNDAPPPATGTDYGTDMQGNAPARDDDFSDIAATNADDDRMADACAVAARDKAQEQDGGYAEVRRMDAAQPAGKGYNIDGEVELRSSYRATGNTTRRFTCAMQDGRVAEVYLSRDVAAR